MRIIIPLAAVALLVACSEKNIEKSAKDSSQSLIVPPEVVLDPKTSNCQEIFKHTSDGRLRDLRYVSSLVNGSDVPVKDQYEKAEQYKQRLSKWRADMDAQTVDLLGKQGKDGLLRYSIAAEKKYDAEKEMVSVTSEGRLRRVNESSYALNFAEGGSSTTAQPMEGFHYTSMSSDSYWVTFVDAQNIAKRLSNGRIAYSKKMAPMAAKGLEIGMSFVGYPAAPFYKTKSETVAYALNLAETKSRIDIFVKLRCIFIFDKSKNELLETIEATSS